MATEPSKARDYWDIYSDLFQGPELEAFQDGRAREDLIRSNAAVFAMTYPENLDVLRANLVADACDICESVTVLNQFVFTERQRLRAIIHILNSVCDRYKIELGNTNTSPGYAVIDRLTRIEKGVFENQMIAKECSAKQQRQLQYLIDHVNGVTDDPEDLSVPKPDGQD